MLINKYRPRTTYTEHQKKVLEGIYRNVTKRPSKEQKNQLGQQLGMNSGIINVRKKIKYLNL